MAVGADKAPGRDVVEAHYSACLFAGVKIGGVNGEVAPGQWEYQVGPCEGIVGPDDLWMSRYILERVCEQFHVDVTLDPKPVPGWAGIGGHTNYSTKRTRTAPGGMDEMYRQAELLRSAHSEHMKVYGEGNELRLTGADNTFDIATFSVGVGRRDVSIRITSKVAAADCGYYDDRRPAANADPYLVTKKIVQTTLLSKTVNETAAIQGTPMTTFKGGLVGDVPSGSRVSTPGTGRRESKRGDSAKFGTFMDRSASRTPNVTSLGDRTASKP
jgi:glutamine synthetase